MTLTDGVARFIARWIVESYETKECEFLFYLIALEIFMDWCGPLTLSKG
jgi:hypothetical protein